MTRILQNSCFVFVGLSLLLVAPARAQSLDDSRGAVEIEDSAAPGDRTDYPAKGAKGQPKVGRKAAQKYMAPAAQSTGSSPAEASRSGRLGSGDHYLALHVGGFVSDNAYKWGSPDSQSNKGSWNFGVTYRVGEWVNSMDLGIRIDVASYALNDGRANKLSFLPVITFPDASSRFPLYFGAGAGLGVFLNQLANESSLSLDYQLFGGVRFFDVFQNTGFFVEAGLKNHFLILSDGQFNGTFAALGAVFTF